MEERGWGWTESKIRQARLIEWLTPQSSSTAYVSVKPFYDAQPDQDVVTLQVVHDELWHLKRRSLIDLLAGIGDIESYEAKVTAQGRSLAEELQDRRADKRLRKAACRDAMVDWLYGQDATSPLKQPTRDRMLDNPRWGVWLAEAFSADDLDSAAVWLSRRGLVAGMMVDQSEGPVRLYLTDLGVTCAEEFESDTVRFIAAMQPHQSGLAIHQAHGVQVGSDNVQVNNYYYGNRLASEELRRLDRTQRFSLRCVAEDLVHDVDGGRVAFVQDLGA